MNNMNVQIQLKLLDLSKTLPTVHLKISVVSKEGDVCPSEETLNHIVWNSALCDSVKAKCKAKTLE